MWDSKIIKFQRREVENSSTFTCVRAPDLSGAPLFRLSAGQARLGLGKHACLNLKKQRDPFCNVFPRIKLRVPTKNLSLIALTVAEILAFKVWVIFPSLSNQVRKSQQRQAIILEIRIFIGKSHQLYQFVWLVFGSTCQKIRSPRACSLLLSLQIGKRRNLQISKPVKLLRGANSANTEIL